MGTAWPRAAAPVLLGLALGAPALAVGPPAGPPEAPRGRGASCVEPVEVMRREHMHLLVHQRERTVREGYRGPRHSLHGCVECHVARDAQGETIPVNAEGQFCAACHAYAAVRMDCFECHATTPDSGRKAQRP